MTIERIVSENGAVTEIPHLTPDEVKLLWECKIITIQRYDEAGEVLTKSSLELLDYSMLGILRFEGEQRLREYVQNAKLQRKRKSSIPRGYC